MTEQNQPAACVHDFSEFLRKDVTEIDIPNSRLGVIFDTETTGLGSKTNRIVELAAIEIDMSNYVPTGRFVHVYMNPEMPIPLEASQVHGIYDADVVNAPKFAEVMQVIVDFFKDKHVIAHNLAFDESMLDEEIARLCKGKRGDKAPLPKEMRTLRDIALSTECTYRLSQRVTVAKSHKLDNLCDRFGVDRSIRTSHGARLDCELLAMVYPHLKAAQYQTESAAMTGLSFDPTAITAEELEEMSVDELSLRWLELKERTRVLERWMSDYEFHVKNKTAGTDFSAEDFVVVYSPRTSTDWDKILKFHCPEDLDIAPYQKKTSAMSIKWK